MTPIESECVRTYAAMRDPRLHGRTWASRRDWHHAEQRWRSALGRWHTMLGAARGWHIMLAPRLAIPCSHVGEPVFYANAAGHCRALLLHVYLPGAIDGLVSKRVRFAAYGAEDPHVTLFTGEVLAALLGSQPTPDLEPENPYQHDRTVPPTSYLWLSRV
jgi:hypothetical protein